MRNTTLFDNSISIKRMSQTKQTYKPTNQTRKQQLQKQSHDKNQQQLQQKQTD